MGTISWRRKRQPAPVFLPGKSYGQRSLAGYSSCGCKELDTTEWLSTYIHTHTHTHTHTYRHTHTVGAFCTQLRSGSGFQHVEGARKSPNCCSLTVAVVDGGRESSSGQAVPWSGDWLWDDTGITVGMDTELLGQALGSQGDSQCPQTGRQGGVVHREVKAPTEDEPAS